MNAGWNEGKPRGRHDTVMTKIFFVIPDLNSGGAQRVFVSLLQEFDRNRFDITLVLLVPRTGHYYELVPKDIRIIQFAFKNTKNSLFALYRLIRKERPDIVLSTLSHLNLIMAFLRIFSSRRILFVAREANTISSSHKNEKLSWLFNLLYRTIYNKLDFIICQSEYMKNDLIQYYAVDTKKTTVIYNPVTPLAESLPNTETRNPGTTTMQLLSIGRLEPQKGFDRLLRIMHLLKEFPFHLRILGEGSLKDELIKLRKELALGDKVEFMGVQPNPFKYLRESHCFLLTSYYEGLPNVVLEAHACGIPVIAFHSPGGTEELIENGFNGWLIPDDDLEAFANKIRSREYLELDSTRIRENTLMKYHPKRITREYEEVLLSCLRRHRIK